MVSWSDGDSSEHSIQYVSSSFDDGTMKIPHTTEDSDFEGLETDLLVLCHEHGKAAERRVAFEGILTGRRFLACAEKEGKNCGLVEWIDPAWPNTMENALAKLWDMYEESKRNMTQDNLMNSFAVHNLTQEKNKLQANYEKLVEDVNAILDAQEQRVLDFNYLQVKRDSIEEKRAELDNSGAGLKAEIEKKDADSSKLQEKYDMVKNLTVAQGSVIRSLKFNHLKEKEKLTEERRKLQIHIDELQLAVEKNNVKLKGIKAIINE